MKNEARSKNEKGKFDYEKTLKTKPEDSFFNIQSYLYVTSKQITKILYHTPITPHQVIFTSLVFGVAASYLIIQPDIIHIVIGAILLFYKNVLDKVDGSLARAKGLDSRRGRFYDSISDFLVTLALFSAISLSLYLKYQNAVVFVIGFAAMIFSMLQCSFFIYYQVSFIKISGKDTVNRLLETVTDEDEALNDGWTLFLQRLFQIIYGWQDLFFYKLDKYLLKKINPGPDIKIESLWYKHKSFLTTSSFLSIGTHMVLIAFCALIQWFELYLFVNLILMNLLLIYCIVFHYFSTKSVILSETRNYKA